MTKQQRIKLLKDDIIHMNAYAAYLWSAGLDKAAEGVEIAIQKKREMIARLEKEEK